MARYQHTPEEVRIRRAIGAMPGGACIADKVGLDCHTPCPVTLESVAAYLEALVAFYGPVMHAAETQRRELNDLKSDLAAVRRVLGTDK